MQLTGPDAARKVDRLVKHGWTRPEIAVALALRSTDTFEKWRAGKSSPLPGTSAALRRLKPKAVGS